MTLRTFLKKCTRIGDIVLIRENGWQIGMTRIDNDELYLIGLSPRLLDEYEVANYTVEQRDWATVDILVVETLPTIEVSNHVRKRMVSR